MTAIDPSKIITYRAWWPGSVLLPGQSTFPAAVSSPDKRIMHRCRVYATSIGLLVYGHVPDAGSPEWGALTPDWWSPIDFEATQRPQASQVPGRSSDIQTAAGLVVVTFTGGCGCGSRLKQWRPSFSTNVGLWPEKVGV